MIKEDGGVESFNFEFTEWSDAVTNQIKNSYVLENWFLANSSHIIDLAFFLRGEPKVFYSYAGGGSDCHPTATMFAGAGTTHSGALFSLGQLGCSGQVGGGNFNTQTQVHFSPAGKTTNHKTQFSHC